MTNLTAEEFNSVVNAALANDERRAAFILFCDCHAARRGEALALRGTDVAKRACEDHAAQTAQKRNHQHSAAAPKGE